MKMKRDTITGIVGIVWSAIWFILIQTQTKVPAKLLEPGPRLLPYVALFVVAGSSIGLVIQGISAWKKDPTPTKPYFPAGGKKKIAKSYILLWAYGIAMYFLGFLITTPFATFAFIYDLKGQTKVKPVSTAIISVIITAALYCMFVYGFSVKLPSGVVFG
jgi:hypothetical protein